MDPVLEAVLLAIVRAAPEVVAAIAHALSLGADPEEAIQAAKRALPKKWDTSEEDAERRRRLSGG